MTEALDRYCEADVAVDMITEREILSAVDDGMEVGTAGFTIV